MVNHKKKLNNKTASKKTSDKKAGTTQGKPVNDNGSKTKPVKASAVIKPDAKTPLLKKKTDSKPLAAKKANSSQSKSTLPQRKSSRMVKSITTKKKEVLLTSEDQVRKLEQAGVDLTGIKVLPRIKYQKRNIAHNLPDIGTVIIGRLKGQSFRAEIVEDPEMTRDHGKAIRSLDDNKLPLAYTINQAAQLFTQQLREKHDMKPIANGWKWWRREQDNSRLFDVLAYSHVVIGSD